MTPPAARVRSLRPSAHPTPRRGGRTRRLAVALAAAAATVLALTPAAPATAAPPSYLTTYGSAELLAPFTDGRTTTYSWTPTLAVSADGSRAVAVWTRRSTAPGTPDRTAVYASTATIAHGAATWSDAVLLSDSSGDPAPEAQDSRVALSADGTGIAVMWTESVNGDLLVRLTTARWVGSTVTWYGQGVDAWLVSTRAWKGQLAMSADGTALLTTWASTAPNGQLFGRILTLDHGLMTSSGEQVDLTGDATVGVDYDAAISGSGGRVVVAWMDDGLSPSPVRVTSWERGSGWMPVGQAEAITGTDMARTPTVVLSFDGSVGLVGWIANDNGSESSFVRPITFDAGIVSWAGTTTTQLSAMGGDGTRLNLALSSDGHRAAASWWDYFGDRSAVYAGTATLTGTTAQWDGTLDAATKISPALDSYNAGIAMSADGSRTTVVWETTTPDGAQLMTATASTSGTTAWDAVGSEARSVPPAATFFMNVADPVMSADGATTLLGTSTGDTPGGSDARVAVGSTTTTTTAAPTIRSTSVASGRTYLAPPRLACTATVPTGTATCVVTARVIARNTTWTTYAFRAVATGSTGLHTTRTGTYRVSPYYIRGLVPVNGVYQLVAGHRYVVVANVAGAVAPRYVYPVPAGRGGTAVPRPVGPALHRDTLLGWTLPIHPTTAMQRYPLWNLAIRSSDGRLHVLHVHVR